MIYYNNIVHSGYRYPVIVPPMREMMFIIGSSVINVLLFLFLFILSTRRRPTRPCSRRRPGGGTPT